MRGGHFVPCRESSLIVKITLLCFRSLHSHAQNYASRNFALTAQLFTLLGRSAFLVALSLTLCVYGVASQASLRWLMQTEFARPHKVWEKVVLRDGVRLF